MTKTLNALALVMLVAAGYALWAVTPAYAGEDNVRGAVMALRVAINCPQLKLSIAKAAGGVDDAIRQERMSNAHLLRVARTVDAWQARGAARGDFCRSQAEALVSSGYVTYLR